MLSWEKLTFQIPYKYADQVFILTLAKQNTAYQNDYVIDNYVEPAVV